MKIRESLFAGVPVGPRSHKISLYADDVIIMVDPEKSLKVTSVLFQSVLL